MTRRAWVLSCVFVAIFGFSGMGNANLITIGSVQNIGHPTPPGQPEIYSLIYDSDQGIVWMDYTHGIYNWNDSMLWATKLNGANVLIYNLNPGINVTWTGDWRLPSTNESLITFRDSLGFQGPDQSGEYSYSHGYNMVNSEMGYLYYESLGENKGFWGTDGTYQGDYGLKNKGPFVNLVSGLYWSSTEYSPYPNTAAWMFNFNDGNQYIGEKINWQDYTAIAVRPGYVEFTSVAEPATMLLLGLGLVGLAGVRRKFKK
jgi:hypothetical protein